MTATDVLARLDEALHEWWDDDHGSGARHACRPVPSEDEFVAALTRHGLTIRAAARAERRGHAEDDAREQGEAERAAAQADTYPTPHDRLSAFIEGTFLEPEERDELRAALEALSADTAPGREVADRIQEAILDLDSRQLMAESQGYDNMDWRRWAPHEIAEDIARQVAALAAPSRDADTAVGGLITELTLAAAGGMARVEAHPDLLRRAANTIAALAAPSRDAAWREAEAALPEGER